MDPSGSKQGGVEGWEGGICPGMGQYRLIKEQIVYAGTSEVKNFVYLFQIWYNISCNKETMPVHTSFTYIKEHANSLL